MGVNVERRVLLPPLFRSVGHRGLVCLPANLPPPPAAIKDFPCQLFRQVPCPRLTIKHSGLEHNIGLVKMAPQLVYSGRWGHFCVGACPVCARLARASREVICSVTGGEGLWKLVNTL